MVWGEKKIVSSMHKKPIPGPLVIHSNSIDGDSFKSPQFHGTPDSVLYAMSVASMRPLMQALGRGDYEPGALGENLTLDAFDETQISVGDIFRIGEVVAQATFPRIPCGKVSVRMQNERGQRLMQECGRSGVYFRILQPGRIRRDDNVELIASAIHRFTIFDVYAKTVSRVEFSPEEEQRILANGAFPRSLYENLRA